MRRKLFQLHLPLYTAILLAAFWSWQTAFRPAPSGEPVVEAWMLNVGQGESVLLREPTGKTLLFDGGPNDSVLSELGSVLPITQHRIDLVVLSHTHRDHIRGLISVLERYEVREIWVSGSVQDSDDFRAFQEAVAREPLTPRYVSQGFTTELGDMHLQVIHPSKPMVGSSPSQAHDATVALRVSFGTQDILLTGDLNEEHEADLLETCLPPTCALDAEVLQVPHHGSASGLTEPFLTAVHPQIALIPVGLNNSFNHPRQVILDRLSARNIPVYRTDLQGRIHLILRRESISVVAEQSVPQ